MRTQRSLTSDRRGFALIAAIWLIVAFVAIGLEISLHARARRLSAANVLEEERGLAAAEAGLEHLRSRLAQLDGGSSAPQHVPTPATDPWRYAIQVLPDTVRLGEERYHVTIRDAGASLNLNRADEEQLRRLLIALRIDAGRATDIAESILDWRDADELHHLHGAEKDDYVRTGAIALPPDAPFSRVDELRYVQGMTPGVLATIRSFVTVVGTGQINLNAAPRPVLLSLPGIGEEAAAVIERMRTSSTPLTSLQELSAQLSNESRERLVAEMPDLLRLAVFGTSELEVRSEGWSDGSPDHRSIDALIVRAARRGIVVWRQSS